MPSAGNILSRKEYPYTLYDDEVSGTPIETVTYEYGDNAWGDLLTKVNGMTATYDEIGNLTKLGNLETYTWEHGRELASQKTSAELAILTQPSDCKGVAGAEAQFSITAAGEDNLTYLWQVSTDDGATWSTSGAEGYNTRAISGFDITAARDGRLYRCIVTDSKGNKRISETAELKLVPIRGKGYGSLFWVLRSI